jgi:hypothetical protein
MDELSSRHRSKQARYTLDKVEAEKGKNDLDCGNDGLGVPKQEIYFYRSFACDMQLNWDLIFSYLV